MVNVVVGRERSHNESKEVVEKFEDKSGAVVADGNYGTARVFTFKELGEKVNGRRAMVRTVSWEAEEWRWD